MEQLEEKVGELRHSCGELCEKLGRCSRVWNNPKSFKIWVPGGPGRSKIGLIWVPGRVLEGPEGLCRVPRGSQGVLEVPRCQFGESPRAS